MSSLELLKIFSARRLAVILQTEAAECGLACLAMVAGYYGSSVDIASLRRSHAVSMKGMTLKGIMEVASVMGFSTRALRLELHEVTNLQLPAILHWKMSHFVVLKGRTAKGWIIHDPAAGAKTLSNDELSKYFTGVALELSPTLNFVPAAKPERLSFTQLWTNIRGLGTALVQAALLTLVLQAWVIISPFFMQVAIDDVLPRFDLNLLNVLFFGFATFAVINALANTVRQLLFLSLGNLVSFQIASNVTRQLLKLPISYFERRHPGDIISRVNAIQPIQNAITTSLLSATVDLGMAAITLVLMFVYSGALCAVAIGAVACLALIRTATFQSMKASNSSTIMAQAKLDSFLLETVRGISTLRLFAAETTRHNVWQTKLADLANAKLNLGRVQTSFSALNDLVVAGEMLLSVYVAVRLSMAGGFTVGMIFAYMAYKSQFMNKVGSLIDRWNEFRMLDLYMRRLGDIVLTPVDPTFKLSSATGRRGALEGSIAVKRLRYRYGDDEPWVLRDVSFEVKAGEHVAIVGRSGSGKTTLLKLLLGLLQPGGGVITVDGEALHKIGLPYFRQNAAAVMQDDKLFAGSLADNIALFDPDPDEDWIVQCAQMAAVHSDILAMPMRYETLVGDMGSALSGGQKQRLFLARALYRRPRILFLDEGTAHLDAITESSVSAAVSKLGITRIVIAHRAETIRHADRVICLSNGAISEQDGHVGSFAPLAAK